VRIGKEQKTIVFGSWLGWSLDGYDLVLMLFIISLIYFPSKDPTLSLLAIFVTYTVSSVMRPVGGALFGSFGDKHGRRKAMIITVQFEENKLKIIDVLSLTVCSLIHLTVCSL
jgi:MHS family proline/betaine transporter-like MFS transporter